MIVCEDDNFSELRIRTVDNKNISNRNLTIDDINVQLKVQISDTVEEDCNCDNDFMVEAINGIGGAIRKTSY